MTKLALTQKDQDLLNLLKSDARSPVSALARQLGLSRTTVQDRLKRLEEQGVIAGYGVKLAGPEIRPGFSAWVSIGVEPRQQISVARQLSQFLEIELLQGVSGKVDFVALVRTDLPLGLDEVLDRIALLPGVNGVETAVILSTKVDRRSM